MIWRGRSDGVKGLVLLVITRWKCMFTLRGLLEAWEHPTGPRVRAWFGVCCRCGDQTQQTVSHVRPRPGKVKKGFTLQFVWFWPRVGVSQPRSFDLLHRGEGGLPTELFRIFFRNSASGEICDFLPLPLLFSCFPGLLSRDEH